MTLKDNMGTSSLDPDNLTRGRDRRIGRGHGTGALGPSDTSDSGSDLHGAPGLAHQVGLDLGLGTGTTSDPEESECHQCAGPDVGDAHLDSDSDSRGTGECAAAARDTIVRDGADIDVDHIETADGREEFAGTDDEMTDTEYESADADGETADDEDETTDADSETTDTGGETAEVEGETADADGETADDAGKQILGRRK